MDYRAGSECHDIGLHIQFNSISLFQTLHVQSMHMQSISMECRWYFYSGITDIFQYLKISLIHLQISVIQLRISVKELQISVIELRISVILLQISSIRHNYRYPKLY